MTTWGIAHAQAARLRHAGADTVDRPLVDIEGDVGGAVAADPPGFFDDRLVPHLLESSMVTMRMPTS